MAVSVKHLKASDGSELEVKGAEYANSAKSLNSSPSVSISGGQITITVGGKNSTPVNLVCPYKDTAGNAKNGTPVAVTLTFTDSAGTTHSLNVLTV